jgi:2-polyprenyl-3-methyl-5-hydroxy-6-metoxy-1,4-benzoquinol methylase
MEERDRSQEEYWKKNFNNSEIVGASEDLQINIARTKNGVRVKEDVWEQTLIYIKEVLNINLKSVVIELCCGNGLIIGELASYCKEAIGIDYSIILLEQLQRTYVKDNLIVEQNDVNTINLVEGKYDNIILYFSIQHFNERDAFLLIEKCIKSLKPNGKMLIGDIPDLDKKWSYINTKEYQLDYFKRVVSSNPKIGHWFQKDFFIAMNNCFPNVQFQILEQPNYQINSDHCFDILIKKNAVN